MPDTGDSIIDKASAPPLMQLMQIRKLTQVITGNKDYTKNENRILWLLGTVHQIDN